RPCPSGWPWVLCCSPRATESPGRGSRRDRASAATRPPRRDALPPARDASRSPGRGADRRGPRRLHPHRTAGHTPASPPPPPPCASGGSGFSCARSGSPRPHLWSFRTPITASTAPFPVYLITLVDDLSRKRYSDYTMPYIVVNKLKN